MKKVLIVDDYSTVSKVYFELLHAHYNVEASIETDEIISRAKRFQPDVIIINADLPGFDAHEFCEIVVDELHIPTVVLVDPLSTTKINIDSCKAQAILSKPLHADDLLQTVARLISLGPRAN